jgi:hypothetical protein
MQKLKLFERMESHSTFMNTLFAPTPNLPSLLATFLVLRPKLK